jgi:hypothetical protein
MGYLIRNERTQAHFGIMNAAQIKIGLAAAIVLAASTSLMVEHRDLERLGAAHESLMREAARLEAANKILSADGILAKSPAPLPDGQFAELLRLRGEVGMLRDATNELAGLRRENGELHSQIAAESERVDELSPEDQFTVKQTHVQDAANVILNAIKNYAGNHSGQIPRDFDDLVASGDIGTTNFAGNLGLGDFELMKSGAVDEEGRSIVFRNRIPVPKPGEDPVWVYGTLGDGRTGIVMTAADLADANVSFNPATKARRQ